MKDVNFNDQTLMEVLQEIDMDLNIIDNSFLAVVKKYYFDNDGKVVGAKPVELLRASPEKCNFVIDKNGRFGRADDGRVVLFCLEHRDKYVLKKDNEVEGAKCETCGRQMYPAYYRVSKGGSKYIYYTNGEMLHNKKFSFGIGYGLPPLFSVWQKIMVLMKMDFFILTAYHLERPPKGMLILKGNRESIDKSWRRLQEEARTNPHMIYPLILEGGKDVKNVMEWLDMTIKSQDIDFIAFRDEMRRTIGALWGVMPIFTGDAAQGFGLSNEGLQILVTNRAVEDEQNIFDEKLLPWICTQLGVTDWKFQLLPNEGRDVVARLQREQMRIQNAQTMAGLGYVPHALMTEDGIDFEFLEPETGEEIPSSARMSVKRPSVRRMQRFEGEPVHGRPSQEGQMAEGEPSGVRRPKYEAEGEVATPSPIQEKGEVTDLKKEDVNWFTFVNDSEDLEVLKSGWSKAVKNRFSGVAGARFGAIEMAGFWNKYAGVTKRKSGRINGILMKAVMEKITDKDKIVKEIVDATGIDVKKAELIAKTELANIANEARKLAYKDRTDVKLFKYVTASDTDVCKACKDVERRTSHGATLDELENVVKFANVGASRGLLVHPGCRCTFVRVKGEKKPWEEVSKDKVKEEGERLG
jgi:hypothetical protein